MKLLSERDENLSFVEKEGQAAQLVGMKLLSERDENGYNGEYKKRASVQRRNEATL